MKIQNINNDYQKSFNARIKLKPANYEKIKKMALISTGTVAAGVSTLEAGVSFLTSDKGSLHTLPDNYANSHYQFMNSKFLDFNNPKTSPLNFQSIIPPFLCASGLVGSSNTIRLANFSDFKKNQKFILNALPYTLAGSLMGLGVSQLYNAESMVSNNMRNEQMIHDTRSLAYFTIATGTVAGASSSNLIEDMDVKFLDDEKNIPS